MLASVLFAIFIVAAMLLGMFLSGRHTAAYAARKGRSWRIWFVAGSLLFPLFPVPWMVLALLPPRSKPQVS
jgi:hypothetical protein